VKIPLRLLRFVPLVAFAALAGALSAANAAPRIEVVGGELLDLGHSRPGRFVREIAITNAGSDTLRILSVTSGCGCLVGQPDRRALAHGDTARVQITVETSGLVAEQWAKSLMITTNDPFRPEVDVVVRVSFRHDLRLRTLLNTVRRDTCAGPCLWTIELENISDTTIIIGAPLIEEMRGTTVALDHSAAQSVAPGEIYRLTGRVTIVGGEDYPSAKILLVSSSAYDPETYVAWFYAPEP
jgi:hypothetical protein